MSVEDVQGGQQYFGFRGVAFGGKRAAGKTEAARYVESAYGCKRVGFGDALKELCAVRERATSREWYQVVCLWAYENLKPLGYSGDEVSRFAERVTAEFHAHEYLYPGAGKQVALLQRVGTEVGRAFDPDLWVKIWQRRIEGEPLVACDDVRFPNELSAAFHAGLLPLYVEAPESVREDRIKARGDAVVCRVAERAHASENSVEKSAFAASVDNSGSLGSLRFNVKQEIDEDVRSRLQAKKNLARHFQTVCEPGMKRVKYRWMNPSGEWSDFHVFAFPLSAPPGPGG